MHKDVSEMGGAQSQSRSSKRKTDDGAWAARATKAARAILRAVPSTTAAQVGAYRLSRDAQLPHFQASGTPSPANGNITWVLFVQSVPGADVYFDSFQVYVEQPRVAARQQDRCPDDVIRACERAAVTLYPRWAKRGATVHVQHALVGGNNRRRILVARSSWIVVNGRMRKHVV